MLFLTIHHSIASHNVASCSITGKHFGMSANYAAGLSEYEDKGKCGLPEIEESCEVVECKILELAETIRSSKHLVAHTGAGVSTSSGIPDFRGPKGVWTLEKEGKQPEFSIGFDEARPTISHLALCALERAGYLKYLITQNVDGLHLRSGFPRDRLSELHGNMFIEFCQNCRRETIRNTAVPTVGLKLTGNRCNHEKKSGAHCRGRLRDVVLDWEDCLPEKDLYMAEHQASQLFGGRRLTFRLADVSLCLGTTLQITPAGSFPLHCKKNGGKLVMVNLQETKHHKKADLVIHAKLDFVMQRLLEILEISQPELEFPIVSEHSENGPSELPSFLQKKSRGKRISRKTAGSPDVKVFKYGKETELSKTEEHGDGETIKLERM